MNLSETQREKTIHNLILQITLYAFLIILSQFNFNTMAYGISPDTYRTSYIVLSVLNVLSEIVRAALIILMLLSVKKLRQSEDTKKQYAVIVIIAAAQNVLPILYYAVLAGLYFIFPGITDNIEITMSDISFLRNIYTFIILFAPLYFYISVIKKEKRDMNWMIVGKLTYLYLFLIRKVIYLVRSLTGYTITTFAWYNSKYPVIAALADSDILIEFSEYFWLLGVIALVIFEIRNDKWVKTEVS